MDLVAIAEKVAAEARPGEQIEAYVVRSRSTEVRAYDGGVEHFSSAQSQGVGVRVVADQREGYAYCGSLTDDDIAFALSEARDNSTFAQPDDALGLAGPDDITGIAAPELDLWRDEMATVTPEEKIRLALDLERATRQRDPRVRAVEAADYGDTMVEAAVANSLGVLAEARRTACSCSTFAIAADGDHTQTGYGFSIGRTIADLDTEFPVAQAVERATRLLGATQIPTRRLPILLDPLVTASFVGLLSTALSGESLTKGRSFFADRVGEEVAAPSVSLLDDPTDARAYSASTFDGEGVPTRPVHLIAGGRMHGFAHNVVTARRVGDGTRTTGSAARGYTSTPGVGFRNLHIEPGTASLGQLMADCGEALYVQSVQGLHSGANPVSGDFSAGAEGLMVRGGAFAEPVREVTIASTLQRMLLDVAAVAGDVRWLPGGASSSLLIAEMTVGGR